MESPVQREQGSGLSRATQLAGHRIGMRLLARCLCQASTLPLGAIPPLAFIHQFQDGCGVCAWGSSPRVITAPVFSSNPQGTSTGKAGERKEARGARAVRRRQGLLPSPRKECQHLLCISWQPRFPPSCPSTPKSHQRRKLQRDIPNPQA